MTTTLGDKARELARTNPWWRSPKWEPADPDLRDAAASGLGYQPSVLDNLQLGGLYILRGPRRVGKTVTTKQAISGLLAAGVPALSVAPMLANSRPPLEHLPAGVVMPRTSTERYSRWGSAPSPGCGIPM